jgi:hypothetical protein
MGKIDAVGLPRYRHTLRIEVSGGDPAAQMARTLTALFQFMRVGELIDAPEGPHRENGRMVVEIVLETTCPVHDLSGDARVEIAVSHAQRVGP